MCSSLRLLVAELLGSWLYLTMGGLGTTRTYSDSLGLPVSWGVSLAAGSLVGGPEAHLNPAVSIAWATVGGAGWSGIPGRLIGQVGGAMLAAISLVYAVPDHVVTNLHPNNTNTTEDFNLTHMMEANSSDFEKVDAWISLPEDGVEIVPMSVVKFSLAAAIFQLLVCSSRGNPVWLGVSLGAVIHAFGERVGAGINPAREATGRLVLAWLGWSWEVVFHDSVWVWIPIVVGVAGCVVGAFLHLALIEMPRRKEEERKIKKRRKWSKIAKMSGMDLDYNYILNLENLSEKEKAVLTSPPPPPPPPPQVQIPQNQTKPPADIDTKMMTLEEELKQYYKQNSLSTPEIQKHLARYRAVSVDNLESRGVGGNGGNSGGDTGSIGSEASTTREGSVTDGKLEIGGGVTVSVKHTCEEVPPYSRV